MANTLYRQCIPSEDEIRLLIQSSLVESRFYFKFNNIIFAFWFLAFAMFPVHGNAAGFDCEKAGNDVERMICGDTHLSMLDERISVLYTNVMKHNPASDTINRQQRKWIQRRNTCNTKECVESSYQARIHEIEGASDNPDCLAVEMPGKYRSIAAAEKCDLIPFIKNLTESGEIAGFIDAGLRLGRIEKIPVSIAADEHQSYYEPKYYSFAVNDNAGIHKIIWSMYIGGSAYCVQESYYQKEHGAEKYSLIEIPNACSDGGCCGVNKALFYFNGGLYSLMSSSRLERVGLNETQVIATFSIEGLSIDKLDKICFSQDKKCQALMSILEKNIGVYSNSPYALTCNGNPPDYNHKHPFYPDAAEVDCCSVDYNNDGAGDLACVTGGGPRWENRILLLDNNNNSYEPDEVLMQKLAKRWQSYDYKTGLPMKLHFISSENDTYLIDYGTEDRGISRAYKLGVYRAKRNSIEYIGVIHASASRRVVVTSTFQ